MNFQNFIFAASQHKVLKFLCEYMGRDFYDSEIARLLPNVSRASANNALRNLAELGITKRYFIGNIALNRVSSDSLFIREFRRFLYITEFHSFVEEIKPFTSFVSILGDYIEKPFSDAQIGDIIIVSEKPNQALQYYSKCSYAKHLKPTVYTEEQFKIFQYDSPDQWQIVKNGLILV